MELVASLTGHQDRVWAVAWRPASDSSPPMFASCSSDKKIKIWAYFKTIRDGQEVFEWQCVHTIEEGHTKTIRSVAWCP
jgi:WD40 repeat protein